jgi:hypothetical protein
MTHYTAKPDTTANAFGPLKGKNPWAVYDWNGMRIVWDIEEDEAHYQADGLNSHHCITRPVRPFGYHAEVRSRSAA